MTMKFEELLRRGAVISLMAPSDGEGPVRRIVASRLITLLTPVLPIVRWWLREIGDLLPPSLRRLLSEHRLQVRAAQDKIFVTDPSKDAGENTSHYNITVGDANADLFSKDVNQRCDLLLDKSFVLERELELPLEAESTLQRVLAFSMDRYTPFTESDVIFGYKILRRDTLNKKILLTLYVVQRDRVEPIVQTLNRMGIEIAAVDIASEDSVNQSEGVDLCPQEWRAPTVGVGRIDKALVLSALILLMVIVLLPFIQRQQETSRLESELANLRGQIHQAESDRQNLLLRLERMSLIQQQTASSPAVLDILLELTHLMSDDAWAGNVSIKSGRVRLSGEASATSELLAQLSQSSIFSDPRFEAPLTQNPKTGHERFVISLAIKGNSDAP